ncbi:Signal transduction histidine kinase [Caloranaerobacter azorensis DSM 13643]|uniref:histidine kinase n=1 Tax=Caloranaerobacter azorensis DSM 13643 TaxID=1121264 RepID=A0A1M5VJI0_9FIRM|nr:sensor histidine kinase [Caloranaerobacter azorensis]SHH75073.1 Signal transduction histidine kinase [Caloranaerobacter azorensis DSM 13643]
MSDKNFKVFMLIKILVLIPIFYTAIYFENTFSKRFYTIILIFIVYMILGVIRRKLCNKYSTLFMSFFIDILLIFFLEYNSRFLINYFLHSFYIVIILEASLTLKRDRSLIVGIVAVLISLIKSIMLIYYKSNLANISEMAFFALINILTLIVTNFAQYNKEEKEKKELLYKELLKAHKKLKEYSDRVEKLTIIEERNRIARDIHDTLGHKMTALIMQLEMSSYMIDENPEKAKQLIEEAKKQAREGLLSIRKVVETLRINDDISQGIDFIKQMADEFSKKTGTDIKLKIKGNQIKIPSNISTVLYRIIQESLTNAVRHGKATKINIEIVFRENSVNFCIRDNGIGVHNIKEGYGLKGIRERVEHFNGKVKFESRGGFEVKGYLPIS